MKRAARLTSETKPQGIKASTWCMIQTANARRASLLAGRGNAAKARAMARYLWSIKDAAGEYQPKIVGPAVKVSTTPCRTKRIRFGSPLRNVPAPFTRKTFG